MSSSVRSRIRRRPSRAHPSARGSLRCNLRPKPPSRSGPCRRRFGGHSRLRASRSRWVDRYARSVRPPRGGTGHMIVHETQRFMAQRIAVQGALASRRSCTDGNRAADRRGNHSRGDPSDSRKLNATRLLLLEDRCERCARPWRLDRWVKLGKGYQPLAAAVSRWSRRRCPLTLLPLT
jgi:hypothetical protein